MKTFAFILCTILLFTGCSKSSSYTNNPNIPDNLHNRPVGASSGELLASSKYTSLKIEVQYMTGYLPDDAALTHLKNTLSALLNKPEGIVIITKEIPASNNLVLSVNDIINTEKQNRTAFTSGNQLAVYCLYTNGTYTDDNVLGIAYKNTSFVLFGKKIADNSGGIGQASRTKLVATVAEHEMGHLMGLVDLGSQMQTSHKDQAHGNHCDNNNCLMYYASETSDILGFLVTGNIPVFDGNCRADLTANGGK
jgi:hypothetical protein